MGVYLVTLLWKEAGFSYLGLLYRNLQQVSRKIPIKVTLNGHYAYNVKMFFIAERRGEGEANCQFTV
jgi:hypothetical protein